MDDLFQNMPIIDLFDFPDYFLRHEGSAGTTGLFFSPDFGRPAILHGLEPAEDRVPCRDGRRMRALRGRL